MYYEIMTQAELLEQFQKYTEFLAAQQQTTQLIIVIVIMLLSFGLIGFFSLRGGMKIFDNLSNAIYKLANVETDRHETQKDLVRAVRSFAKQNDERYEKVDIMWIEIKDKVEVLDKKYDKLHSVMINNPTEHQRVIELLTEINNKLEDTKHKTDELEAINE